MQKPELIAAIVAIFVLLMTILLSLYFIKMKQLDLEMIKIQSPMITEVEKPKKTFW